MRFTMKKNAKFPLQYLLFSALCTALIAIFSQFSLYIGPVPFSFGIFAIMLTATLLPPNFTLFSISAYLLLGAFGIPVFSGMGAGLSSLFGPTGGFLWGYLPLGFFISFSVRKFSSPPLIAMLSIFGLSLCYLSGTLYFTLLTNTPFFRSLSICVLPFILPDLIKMGGSLFIGNILSKRLAKILHTSLI